MNTIYLEAMNALDDSQAMAEMLLGYVSNEQLETNFKRMTAAVLLLQEQLSQAERLFRDELGAFFNEDTRN